VWLKYSGRVVEWAGNDTAVRVIGSVTDVTKQKVAEQDLTQARNFLNEISQTARIGGWEIDLIHKKTTWTKVTREIFEVPDDYEPHFDPQTGNGIRFFNAGETRVKLMKAMHEAMINRKPYDLELKIT